MDEYELYPGQHTGEQIDEAVDKALYPTSTLEYGSELLPSSGAVFKAISDSAVLVDLGSITANGNFAEEREWRVPSGAYGPMFTPDHVVAKWMVSNPAVVKSLTLTISGSNSLQLSGTIYGTSNIAFLIVKPGGTLT